MQDLTLFEKITLTTVLRKKIEDSQWMVDNSSSGEEIKEIFRKDILETKEIARKLSLFIA